MRPIIGNGIAIPHIRSVPIIGERGAEVDGILRHLPLVIAHTVEMEGLLGIVGR